MKTYKKQTVSQLVASFDNELRTLLMNDLHAVKAAKNKLTSTTGLNQDSLTAA